MKNRLERSLRVTFIGMAVNTLLAATKLAAGLIGHSQALIADGVESFADVLSSLIVWRGVVIAAAPADEDHPYGHGKAEPIAAAIVALMLLLAAAGIIISAVLELTRPHLGPKPFTLFVIVGVVLIKESLFRFVLREAKALENMAVHTEAWHHRSDAITSLAAFLGITVSIIGGHGYEGADDIAAIAAAGVIGWNGWRLLRPALSELMDTTPDSAVNDEIRAIALSVAGVDDVEKCVVRKMGYQYFVELHVEVDPQMSVARGHDIAHSIKDQVRHEIPTVYDVLVHVEPTPTPKPAG